MRAKTKKVDKVQNDECCEDQGEKEKHDKEANEKKGGCFLEG